MEQLNNRKKFENCELVEKNFLENDVFKLVFAWDAEIKPKAGQFFLIRPKRSSALLGRPISVSSFSPSHSSSRGLLHFLIMKIGSGTEELSQMFVGEQAELIGPLGNGWSDFLEKGRGGDIALVSGGLGIAPLLSFLQELEGEKRGKIDFYAGFKTAAPSLIRLLTKNEGNTRYDPRSLGKIVISTEDGSFGEKGFISDFLEPEKYRAVFSCGTLPMLKVITELCEKTQTPCFISMENRMACGVGACLGCTIKTVSGNKRCCADGAIFPSKEIVF